MPTKIVNTSSINGPATDFTSLYPSILVQPDGTYFDILSMGIGSWYEIPCGSTITVPEYRNMIVVGTLDLCGTLVLNGRLVSI